MSSSRITEGKSRADISFLVVIATIALFLTHRAYAIDPALGRFSGAKEQQVRELARTITNKVPAIVWGFFDAVRVDDWETATNLASLINAAGTQNQLADQTYLDHLNALVQNGRSVLHKLASSQ
jgi:hypothetical protein